MLQLSARGDHRNVIRVVETWVVGGNPTRRARFAEARALFALRLMDRAMARAREVTESNPEDVEAQRLLAEIYLERGWPSHARKILTALREHRTGAEVEELWKRAQAEPVRLGQQAREIEGAGDPAALIGLAEYFLTTGSSFRAQSILERLRRMDPENRRVQDLLWGLNGTFTSKESPLDKLLEELGGAELAEEPEHTEAKQAAVVMEEGANFPSLFKATVQASRRDDREEHTSFSPIATREQMLAAQEDTDPGKEAAQMDAANVPGRSEDTQIMLVLRPGENGQRKPLHIRKDENLRETLNLRDWQASMGVQPSTERETSRLEEEDENLVQLSRSAPAPEPLNEPTESRKRPMEVIEKVPVPSSGSSLLSDPEPESEEASAPPPAAPDMGALTKLLAALVALMGLAFFALIVLIWFLQG
ncbi:MAG TPA: hypothetical protein PKY30_00120 [Myxococcota bacterium]|nr:hypothetical protein [Myxococcota bacterium]HNH45408.1 hypothetical protein [Myxococcota bacterium]